MYSFATPPIKLKLGHQIGAGLLIANHLDQSLCWAISETLSSSLIQFITLFFSHLHFWSPALHFQDDVFFGFDKGTTPVWAIPQVMGLRLDASLVLWAHLCVGQGTARASKLFFPLYK
jgi:hypothetical protein